MNQTFCRLLLLAHNTQHTTPHTPHTTPHTSHLTPHTSHLTPHTSHLTPHTSHLTPHTSHLTPHTSHLTPLRWMSNELQVDVITYDYVGYGLRSQTCIPNPFPQCLFTASVASNPCCLSLTLPSPVQLGAT